MQRVRIALAAVAVTGAIGFECGPAEARDYPWCAQYSERTGGGGRNCGFVSLDQCRATISGIGGICEPNPRYATGRGDRRRDRRDNRR
jgi:hypothetical protein